MDQLRLPSYYTILPASVRYDMELSFFEMVLYSEIIALATVTGYCHASNGYFSMLYKKDERVISRSISKLQARGHIRLLIENGYDRRIYILTPPLLENKRPFLVSNEQPTPDNSVYPPPDKNVYPSPAHNARTNASNKERLNKTNLNIPPSPDEIGLKTDQMFRPDLKLRSPEEMPEALRSFFDSWPKS